MTPEEKAKINLKGFIKTTKKLFIDSDINFDLVIASGDSGQEMAYLLKTILGKIGKDTPPILLLPLYRFTRKGIPFGLRYDNSIFLDEVKNTPANLKTILFVDDEIGVGITLRTFVELLKKAGKIDRPKLYVVGEDKGVFEKDKLKDVELFYEPFEKAEKNIMNAISYLVPLETRKIINESFGELSTKEIMNSLLNLPIKYKEKGKPFWTMGLSDELYSKVSEFNRLHLNFQEYLNGLISEYINE